MGFRRRAAAAALALLPAVALRAQEPDEPAVPQEPPVVAPALRLGRLEPRPPVLFDPAADPEKDIAAGVARARKEGRRVLLLWGSDWCSWSRGLDRLLQKSPSLRFQAAAEYVIVRVDVGRYDRNSDLLASYDVDLERTRIPVLSVLDGEGGLLFSGESGFLESRVGSEKGFDVQKVQAFLSAYRIPPKSADDALASALRAAATSKRHVLVHFEVPLRPPCVAFEEWIARPEVRTPLEKDFVVLEIDLQRMSGADFLLARLRDPDSKGLPWMAVLDPSGKRLATSDTEECRNILYPQSEAEIAHFGSMLAKGTLRLFPPDIEKLEDSLRTDREERARRAKTPVADPDADPAPDAPAASAPAGTGPAGSDPAAKTPPRK
jgi:hypothetical protein